MTFERQRRGLRVNWRIAGWSLAVGLLLLPFLAMQFTSEVDWDETDFILFGMMLAVAGGLIELAVRMSGSSAYRLAFAIGVVGAFLLIWMNLAVGIIGSEDNPLNLMYGAILAVGLIGALTARFDPEGMARALTAMAVAQILVAVIAQAAGYFTWIITLVYVALWLGSAKLFRKSARPRVQPEPA
jgi:hypothetical protein